MITLNRDTGAMTWDVYTIQPDMTVADFREQIAMLSPTGDKASFDESAPKPPPQGIFSFLRRASKEAPAIRCQLPRIHVDDMPLTGQIIFEFENGLMRDLVMKLELSTQDESNPLPIYNRFLVNLLELTNPLLPEYLDKPFAYHANWGIARTVRLQGGTWSSDNVVCELHFKTPQERAARPTEASLRETNPDIVALIAAQKAYTQAKAHQSPADAEAKRLLLHQRLKAATTVPGNSVYTSVGSSFPIQQEGAKHFMVLTELDQYVQNALLNKNDAEVIAAASVMLLLEPDDAAIYAIRAEAYQTLKRYDEARADYTKAIEKVVQKPLREMKTGLEVPDLKAEYLWKRGYVYRLQGNYARAIADYTESIAVEPGAQAFTLRAVAHLQQFDLQEAHADFEKALKLQPNNPTNQYNRGICRAFLNDLDGALTDIQAANEKAQNNAMIIGSLAWVYRLRQEFPQAIKFAEQAIAISPQYGPPYYSRGAARAALGDTAGALVDFQVALERWEEVRTPLYAPFAKEMDDFIATHRGDEA